MYSDSEDDASVSSNRPRRVSLIGNAVDAEELCKGLSAAAATGEELKKYEPGSGPDEEEDESQMTQEQISKYFWRGICFLVSLKYIIF